MIYEKKQRGNIVKNNEQLTLIASFIPSRTQKHSYNYENAILIN